MTRWMPDFSHRSNKREIMDDLDVDETELLSTLDELSFINRTLGGYGPSLQGVRSLLPPSASRFSLLDVGTGGGDGVRRLHRWAAARGIAAQIRGIDLSLPSIERARRHCKGLLGIEFQVQDLMDLPERETFDIVHCALVLHHFDDDAAAAVLTKMFALSRWGVVINDLHRHPVAYSAIRLLTQLFSKNRMIRNDGPLSVRRAFQRDELKRLARMAGLPTPTISWHWGFRWLVSFSKGADRYHPNSTVI